MDLDLAVVRHTEWKTRLLAAISNNETLDTATIAKDTCCDLGKWLHGDAKTRFGALTSHANCVAQHARFHIEASKVAAAINTRKYTDAQTMLGPGTAYSYASSAVQVAISNLKTQAGL